MFIELVALMFILMGTGAMLLASIFLVISGNGKKEPVLVTFIFLFALSVIYQISLPLSARLKCVSHYDSVCFIDVKTWEVVDDQPINR